MHDPYGLLGQPKVVEEKKSAEVQAVPYQIDAGCGTEKVEF